MTLDAAHACVVDLDGVVWLGGTPLPGATEGVAALRERGIGVRFATNNAMRTLDELGSALAAMGIASSPEELVTSAEAAASLLDPGSSAYLVGGEGLRAALEARGVRRTATAPDAVVVGLTTSFDYDRCDRAASLVRDGARFVASNDDATFPGPRGLHPGAGSIVAAIATAAGRPAEVAGKPHPPMVRIVRSRGGVGAVVGDRPSTDGAFAAALGVPFVHVASEVREPATTALATVPTLLDAVRLLCDA